MSADRRVEGSLRVLLVEDHVDTRKSIADYLRKSDCEVTESGCVQDAVRKLSNKSWDLLLSDIQLPDGTGWDVLENSPLQQPIFTASMSAHNRTAIDAESRVVCFQHHLQKPFSPSDLDSLIDEVALALGKSDQQRTEALPHTRNRPVRNDQD